MSSASSVRPCRYGTTPSTGLPVFASSQSSPGLQQTDVAAKAVDDEAAHPRLLARRQTRERAGQMREHAAAIDIGHQHDRAIDRFRETHVGDVAIAQIDLGGTARAFDENRVVRRLQTRIRFQHRLERDGLVVVIRARIEIHARLAVDDHLRAAIAGRLEQHRIQIGVRGDARRHRLQRLSAADLAAVDRHRAVERHVLRLERRDPHAARDARAGTDRRPACSCPHRTWCPGSSACRAARVRRHAGSRRSGGHEMSGLAMERQRGIIPSRRRTQLHAGTITR